MVVSAASDVRELDGALVVDLGDSSEPVRVPLGGLGRVEIPAAEGTIARVESVVTGYWGALVAAIAGRNPVVVRLFATGTLEGSLRVPAGIEPPTALRASFEAPLEVRSLGVPTPAGAVDCPVADAHWTCTLPEGLLDLRLHASGFSSALLWEVPVQPGATSPGGTVALVPGASIIGRVAVEDAPEGGLDEVEVEIRPEGAEWRDAHRGERLGALFHETGVDDRGFFQFRDLRPGFYRIEARLAGLASAVRVPIEVVEGRETDLGLPLVLLPPSRLELHLDPAEGPDGQRWSVALSSLDGRSDRHLARVDWTGDGRIDGLAPGPYRYRVTSGGSTWARGTVEVSGERTVQEIAISRVAVENVVRRGEEPVRARILFGDSAEYPEEIEMFSDHQGRFYLVPGVERGFPLRPIKTGPLGEFREQLPGETSFVHILVMAPGYTARLLSRPLPPGRRPVEDVDIAVGEIGGTLRVELPATGVGGLVLERGPTRMPLRFLDEWMTFHGTRPRQGEPWVLPRMEAGAYRLCRLDECDAGVLAPGGELVLTTSADESRRASEPGEHHVTSPGRTSGFRRDLPPPPPPI